MTETTLPRRDFYVYKLLRLDGRPFYVGKGTGTRIKMHEYKSKRGASYKDNIICQILAMGLEVPKVIVADGLTHEEANALEIRLIAEIGRHPNGPLTNRTRGGEGIIDMPAESAERKLQKLLGRVPTLEARAKISKAASNPSATTRSKMRAARLGKPLSAETRQKMSVAGAGKKRSESTKAKMRASAKLRPAERYQRAGATRRGSHHTDETKEKLRAAAQKQWTLNRDSLLVAMAKRPPTSDATRALMSARRKGKKKPPMSEATKAKLRAARLRQAPMSAEARAKVSAAGRARPPQSAETRQKRRESVLRAIAKKKAKEPSD